jgi:benzoyl-CoA reductase/2-hydroxyglutaryl-CoA dehydratase subunit BcrC/BadD/HgdB
MKRVAYVNPLVPPEWIAAHGLKPRWQLPELAEDPRDCNAARGICPFAATVVAGARNRPDVAALVLTTTCDQMRHAAALVERIGLPVFLMHVPATWQTASSHGLYREELLRLGRFLVRLGGTAPNAASLARVMRGYEDARRRVLSQQENLPARQFAAMLAQVRGCPVPGNGHLGKTRPSLEPRQRHGPEGGIPLALVGGPLLKKDYSLFDAIEAAGGRVVLDATEGGQRTLPAPFDLCRIETDPLQALADAYFGGIPDVFRCPNTRLHEWLAEELPRRGVRGILFRRYLWCDLWHAELHTLRQRSPVPVLDLDAAPDDQPAANRALGRLEALLEVIAAAPQ